MKIFILYPNQLFKNVAKLKDKKVLLIEEPLFFTQYEFHIQKLVLHRASMKFYESYLKQNNILIKKLHGAHVLLDQCVRITIGAPKHNDAVLAVVRSLYCSLH